jgi:hypothetical protein
LSYQSITRRSLILGSTALMIILLVRAEARADSCSSALCMAGIAMGVDGGSPCSGPVSDFYSINDFNSDGSFNSSQTQEDRRSYLRSCNGVDAGTVYGIMSKGYGAAQGYETVTYSSTGQPIYTWGPTPPSTGGRGNQ